MVRISVLKDCFTGIVNADKFGKPQVLVRSHAKKVVKFLQEMQFYKYIGDIELMDENGADVVVVHLIGCADMCGAFPPFFAVSLDGIDEPLSTNRWTEDVPCEGGSGKEAEMLQSVDLSPIDHEMGGSDALVVSSNTEDHGQEEEEIVAKRTAPVAGFRWIARNIARNIDNVPWGSLAFGSLIRPLRSDAQWISWSKGNAQSVGDIYLVNTFLEIAKVKAIDRNGINLAFKSLNFLRRCRYTAVDICSVLAHASAYFADWLAQHAGGRNLTPLEAGYFMVITIFLGHSYSLDENCRLRHWHHHLFKDSLNKEYCSLPVLSEAVLAVMRDRGFVLRVKQQDLFARNEALRSSLRCRLVPGKHVC